MVIKANIGNSVGATTTYTVNGGRIAEGLKGHPYKTPYQIKFGALLLKKALSTTYDSTASATYAVVVPCGSGELPDGWAYTTTQRTDVLPGVYQLGLYYYPEDDLLTGGSGTYADDENNFSKLTSMPLKVGEKVGLPTAASQTISVNSEIASGANGLCKVATSGDFVIGLAEEALTTTSATVTPSTVKFTAVKFCPVYKKA